MGRKPRVTADRQAAAFTAPRKSVPLAQSSSPTRPWRPTVKTAIVEEDQEPLSAQDKIVSVPIRPLGIETFRVVF